MGQGVHQGRLAGVGVADQADRRHVPPAGDLALAAVLDLAELLLEVADPLGDEPAVLFELLLARPSDADAALVAGQVGPHPLEPGQGVFELRQLDLEVGLVGPRPGGEDVEDHLGPVDHLDPEELLQVPRLRRAEVVVEDDEVGLVRPDQLLELVHLARADIGGDVDLMPLLEHPADHDQAGRLDQPAELLQRVVGRVFDGVQEDLDQDRLLAAVRPLGALDFDQSWRVPRVEAGEIGAKVDPRPDSRPGAGTASTTSAGRPRPMDTVRQP